MSDNTTPKGHGKAAMNEKDPQAKPEAMVLGIGAWILALSLEAVQQLLNTGATFFDMGNVRTQLARALKEQGRELSESMIAGLATVSLIFSAVLGLVILGVIGYFVHKVSTRGKNADSLQKLLSFFGGYLMFKALMITFTPPSGNLPVAYYAVSGGLQIIVGVAAVVGAVLINRKESVDWVAGEKKGNNDRTISSSRDKKDDDQDSSGSLWGSLFGKDKNADDSEKKRKTDDQPSKDELSKKQ